MATQPTRFEIRPARAWRVLVLALATLAMAASLLWAATVIDRGAPGLVWLAVPAFLIGAWGSFAGRAQAGVLHDAGGQWWFEPGRGSAAPEAEPGSLDVAADFGAWMLLRFRAAPSRRTRWLAPSSRDMHRDWPAFRRAVYSPRPIPAGRSAQAPADPPA